MSMNEGGSIQANKVKFEVLGSSYIISTQDDSNYIASLAAQIDEDVQEVLESSPNASTFAATIICTMGYLDDAKKAVVSLDNMREQIRDYLQESEKAKQATEQMRRELERLRAEVQRLASNRPPV